MFWVPFSTRVINFFVYTFRTRNKNNLKIFIFSIINILTSTQKVIKAPKIAKAYNMYNNIFWSVFLFIIELRRYDRLGCVLNKAVHLSVLFLCEKSSHIKHICEKSSHIKQIFVLYIGDDASFFNFRNIT